MALVQVEAGNGKAPSAIALTEARTARAFARARRHSRLVVLLRWLIPIGAVTAVAVVVALTMLRSFALNLGGVSIDGAAIDGTKIVMAKPRLTGARPDGSAYVINVARGVQDIRNPTQIELFEVDGDIGSRDQSSTKLTADTGKYDSTKELLHLAGNVHVRNASYTINLLSADVDMKAGVYETHEPLQIIASNGVTIEADSALALDNASKIRFLGHVKTMIPPQNDKAEAPQLKSDSQ